ncbi:MAG: hypothetical protein VXZ58_06425, partial [Actinomycetota bacterium]|nr:hypothetical protein [Actinomycetota bacterium]
SSTQELSSIIAELVWSADTRVHFRNKGLEIAAKFATERIAEDLRRIIFNKLRKDHDNQKMSGSRD